MPDKPLQQVFNRYFEINSTNKTSLNFICYIKIPELKRPHKIGPLVHNINGQQYNTIIFNNFKINVEHNKDCFFLTNNNEVVMRMNVVQVTDDILLIGKKYGLLSPFFTNPINSTVLEIFVSHNLPLDFESLKLSDMKKK